MRVVDAVFFLCVCCSFPCPQICEFCLKLVLLRCSLKQLNTHTHNAHLLVSACVRIGFQFECVCVCVCFLCALTHTEVLTAPHSRGLYNPCERDKLWSRHGEIVLSRFDIIDLRSYRMDALQGNVPLGDCIYTERECMTNTLSIRHIVYLNR